MVDAVWKAAGQGPPAGVSNAQDAVPEARGREARCSSSRWVVNAPYRPSSVNSRLSAGRHCAAPVRPRRSRFALKEEMRLPSGI